MARTDIFSRFPALAVLMLGFGLAGCSGMTARGKEPAWVGSSRTGLSATTSCVIKSMNAAMHSDNALATSFTHQAGIIDPDRVIEIAPQQTITIGAEVYFVRLTATSKSSTSIELFGGYTWADKIKPALISCA